MTGLYINCNRYCVPKARVEHNHLRIELFLYGKKNLVGNSDIFSVEAHQISINVEYKYVPLLMSRFSTWITDDGNGMRLPFASTSSCIEVQRCPAILWREREYQLYLML